MRKNRIYPKTIVVMLGLLLLPAIVSAASTTPASTDHGKTVIEKTDAVSDNPGTKPEVFAPEVKFNFGQVVDGTEVIHDFVIQNKGTGDLKISRVRTGWGCTAADYPRLVPPGGEGKIKIKVNTNNRGGQKLRKKITVYTNDKQLALNIEGDVERFVTVSPKRVNLQGTEGEPITRTVTIVPEKKYPFKVLKTRAKNGKEIRYKLTEEKKGDKTEYKLSVENLKAEKGTYWDKIYLDTDSSIKPVISISVYGNIRQPKVDTDAKTDEG